VHVLPIVFFVTQEASTRAQTLEKERLSTFNRITSIMELGSEDVQILG
jgi:hypothetical protein